MAVARKSDNSVKSGWFGIGRSRRRNEKTLSPNQKKPTSKSRPTSANLGQQDFLQQTYTRRQRSSIDKPRDKNKIPVMPPSNSLPKWLISFYTVHRYSSVVAFLLVASTLVIYGLTVYSQQVWSQSYRRMQNLQRDERQMTTFNENVKNKMAKEAEKPSAGLVSPSPEGLIFLRPTSANNYSEPTDKKPEEELPQNSTPVGY